MKCKRIQDLIMSGYIDGELKGSLLKRVQQHLSVCQQCKQFEQIVLKQAVNPFRQAQEIKPPEFVWEGIKEAIYAKEEERVSVLESLRGGLDSLLYAPKPALVFATAAVIILLAVVFIRGPFGVQRLPDSYLDEHLEVTSYLEVSEAGSLDFGTAIEEYLM
jgi:predicted anti-sigma-YlaC factor YlaD